MAAVLISLASSPPVRAGTAPSFILDATSPTVAATPTSAGDLLRPAAPPGPGPVLPATLAPPLLSIDLAALGLVAGDSVRSISFGRDEMSVGTFHFAVDRGTHGIAGSFPPDVSTEGTSDASSDVFQSFFPPNNTQALDGDGRDDPNPPPDGFGLDETTAPRDALAGFDLCPADAVDPDGDGIPDQPVYLTLAAGSPTLVPLGAGPHDILQSAVGVGGSVSVWRAGASLGLVSGDAIDALATDGASVYFSLAPGSPTLLGPDGEADAPMNPPGVKSCERPRASSSRWPSAWPSFFRPLRRGPRTPAS
jgi:hypothetical protein